MAKRTQEHRFGSGHTETKLDVLTKYLQAYMSIMKNQRFSLWYIDAFAGSGTRIEVREAVNDLFGEIAEERKPFEGSASRALKIERPFHHYRFIESHNGRRRELEKLIANYPEIDAKCLKGDANDELKALLSADEWTKPTPTASHRGVIFLDPYGLSVDYETLEIIAKTQKLDVWYLLNFEGIYRQAAHNVARVDKHKDQALTRSMGASGWRDMLYEKVTRADMLQGKKDEFIRKPTSEMQAIVKKNLERLFPFVSEPLDLPVGKSPPQFLLFFCVSNPDEKAIEIAQRVAGHIIKLGKLSQKRP
jgi:three-Cys-motif partner protein